MSNQMISPPPLFPNLTGKNSNRLNAAMEQKIFLFLTDLRNELESGREFSKTDFCRRHKIGNQYVTIAERIGLFQKVGAKKYKWSALPPDLPMANLLAKNVNDYFQNHKARKKVASAYRIAPFDNTQSEQIAELTKKVDALLKYFRIEF